MTKSVGIGKAIKEKSKLSKEEWREYTKTVWTIANTSRDDHPAVFPEEIPLRLAKTLQLLWRNRARSVCRNRYDGPSGDSFGTSRYMCGPKPRLCPARLKEKAGALGDGHESDFEPLVTVCGDSRRLDFIEDNSIRVGGDEPALLEQGRLRDFKEKPRKDRELCGLS